MRQVLRLALILLAAGAPGGCAGHRVAPSAAPATATAPVPVEGPAQVAEAPEPDVFRARVAPLLAQRCAPCHNPGGSMYGRMPFDDPATVLAHPTGILKRFKEPAEHAVIERWLADQAKS